MTSALSPVTNVAGMAIADHDRNHTSRDLYTDYSHVRHMDVVAETKPPIDSSEISATKSAKHENNVDLHYQAEGSNQPTARPSSSPDSFAINLLQNDFAGSHDASNETSPHGASAAASGASAVNPTGGGSAPGFTPSASPDAGTSTTGFTNTVAKQQSDNQNLFSAIQSQASIQPTAPNLQSPSSRLQLISTTLSLTESSPTIFGQPITFTATVSSNIAGPAPVGTILFEEGTKLLGTGALDGNAAIDQATFTTSDLAAGSHVITAVFSGDQTHAGSIGTLNDPVLPAPAAGNIANTSTPANTVTTSSGAPATTPATNNASPSLASPTNLPRVSNTAALSNASSLVTLAAPAGAVALTDVFATGVDANGNLLADGAADPHYQIVSSTDPSYSSPQAAKDDGDTGQFPFNGYWMNNSVSALSKWDNPSGDAGTLFPTPSNNTTYTYETTFDLTGFDPTSAQLVGRWSTDNQAIATLNGNALDISTPNLSYRNWSSFTISSGFVAGINKLDFVVTNTDNPSPSGIRVEISGTATALPVVSIVATTPNASETGPTNGLFTVTRTGSTTNSLVVNYTVGGTAAPNIDFTSLSGTVTIAAGQSSATIDVPVLNDMTVEPDETVKATLTPNPTSYTIQSGQDNATVTIQDTGTFTTKVLTSDPYTGNSLLQKGNVKFTIPLKLDKNINNSSCSKPTIGMTYNSDSVSVKPIVQALIPTESTGPLPTSVDVQLTWDGNVQASKTEQVQGVTPGNTITVADQVATAVTVSGRHQYSMKLTFHYADGSSSMKTQSGSTMVVVEDNSSLGRGWTFTMVNKLLIIPASGNDPAGVLFVCGTGESRFFTQNPDGTFTGPSGEQGKLTQNPDGSYSYMSRSKLWSHFFPN